MKTMIVTGASGGLGRALCEYFAKQDVTVCAVARSRDKLAELEKAHPGRIFAYPADLSVGSQVKQVFGEILEQHKTIDTLVNNAGILRFGEFYEQDFDTIDQVIDTNLKGTMYCTQMVLPAMISAGKGDIINISSVGGTRGNPQAALYCSSKHGMIGFGDSIAQGLRSKGVRVTTLCPGGIDTPIWTEEHPHPEGADKLMTPEDVAELIQFIISQPQHMLYKRVVFFPMCEWA